MVQVDTRGIRLRWLVLGLIAVQVVTVIWGQHVLITARTELSALQEAARKQKDEIDSGNKRLTEMKGAERELRETNQGLTHANEVLAADYAALELDAAELIGILQKFGIQNEHIGPVVESLARRIDADRNRNPGSSVETASCPTLRGVEEAVATGLAPVQRILDIAAGEPAFDRAILRGLRKAQWNASPEELRLAHLAADRLVAAGVDVAEARFLRGSVLYNLGRATNDDDLMKAARTELEWVAAADLSERGFDAYQMAVAATGILTGSAGTDGKVEYACDPKMIAGAAHRGNLCARLLYGQVERLRGERKHAEAVVVARRALSFLKVTAYGESDPKGTEDLARLQKRLQDFVDGARQ